MPIRVLFVCHGNICRSPMAEFLFRRMLQDSGLKGVECASAALHTDEIGSPVHRGTAKILSRLGIDYSRKRAELMRVSARDEYDYILGMDRYNQRDLQFRLGRGHRAEIGLLGDYATPKVEIDDPWYTGDFERTYREISAGCEGLLRVIAARVGKSEAE